MREIQIAAKLTHSHILPLHDSGDVNGMLYYVMPYVECESLRARLQRDKRLAVEDAPRLTREVAEALGYAHKQEIVHRDINRMESSVRPAATRPPVCRVSEEAGNGPMTGLAISIYMS